MFVWYLWVVVWNVWFIWEKFSVVFWVVFCMFMMRMGSCWMMKLEKW